MEILRSSLLIGKVDRRAEKHCQRNKGRSREMGKDRTAGILRREAKKWLNIGGTGFLKL